MQIRTSCKKTGLQLQSAKILKVLNFVIVVKILRCFRVVRKHTGVVLAAILLVLLQPSLQKYEKCSYKYFECVCRYTKGNLNRN